METGETDLKREKNEDEKREKSASISMILQLNWPDIYILLAAIVLTSQTRALIRWPTFNSEATHPHVPPNFPVFEADGGVAVLLVITNRQISHSNCHFPATSPRPIIIYSKLDNI